MPGEAFALRCEGRLTVRSRQVIVELELGCNHITCTCGHHFCYKCGCENILQLRLNARRDFCFQLSVFCNNSLDDNQLCHVWIIMSSDFLSRIQQEGLNIMHSYKMRTIAPRQRDPL